MTSLVSGPILAGLVLGFAGSAHCAAMCGPLAIALRGAAAHSPNGGPARWPIFAAYHATRLGAYAGAGAIAGAFGHGLSMLGIGRALSVAAGLLLVGSALASLDPAGGGAVASRVARRLGRVATILYGAAGAHALRRAIVGGLVNACLPCGMLYAALAAAAALGHAGDSSLFMTLFGIGTLPAIAACWTMADALGPWVRRHLRFAMPWTLAAVGVLLIARGLSAAIDTDAHAARHGAHTHATPHGGPR